MKSIGEIMAGMTVEYFVKRFKKKHGKKTKEQFTKWLNK